MCRCLDILLLLVFKAAIYKFNINSVQNKRVQEVKVSFVGEGGGGWPLKHTNMSRVQEKLSQKIIPIRYTLNYVKK